MARKQKGRMKRKTKANDNNYAFIDSQNVNLAIRDQGWQLDFKRFRVYLKEKYKVSKALLFIGYLPGNQELYTYLQDCGFIVVFKPPKKKETKMRGNYTKTELCKSPLIVMKYL